MQALNSNHLKLKAQIRHILKQHILTLNPKTQVLKVPQKSRMSCSSDEESCEEVHYVSPEEWSRGTLYATFKIFFKFCRV